MPRWAADKLPLKCPIDCRPHLLAEGCSNIRHDAVQKKYRFGVCADASAALTSNLDHFGTYPTNPDMILRWIKLVWRLSHGESL